MPTPRTFVVFIAFAAVAFGQTPSNLGASDGPPVVVDQAGPGIFPPSWLAARIDAKAEPLAEADRERARRIMTSALQKYPASVLAANLKTVYVVGRLEYGGVAAGGTNSRSVVYVVGRGDYSAADVERIFHAEFSSILLRNFRRGFADEAWRKINPPEFRYLGSGVQAVRAGQASDRPRAALYQAGFLTQYAQASIEEDFNSIASRLIMGDEALSAAVERHPQLRAKAELVIEFYGRLDPSFTRDRFRTLRAAGESESGF